MIRTAGNSLGAFATLAVMLGRVGRGWGPAAERAWSPAKGTTRSVALRIATPNRARVLVAGTKPPGTTGRLSDREVRDRARGPLALLLARQLGTNKRAMHGTIFGPGLAILLGRATISLVGEHGSGRHLGRRVLST